MDRDSLLPPPPPELESMEPAVRDQFVERRFLLESVLSDPESPDADVAWALGQMGRVYQAYRHLDQAVWCYQHAHHLDPTVFDWPYLLAHLQVVLGDAEAARDLFLRAHALRPEEPGPLVGLGQLALEDGDLATAETYYRQALDLRPMNALARYGLARVETESGHYADAVERLRRLLEEQPRAYQAQYALADALKRAGREDSARIQLEATPTSPLERVGLRSRDRWLEAIQELPVSATALEKRGRQALLAGQVAEAIRWFRKAEQIAPERREVRFNLATALARAGRTDEAIEYLHQVIANFPNFDSAYRLLGTTRLGSGDMENAEIWLRKAIELEPRSEANLRALADLQVAQGDLPSAIGSFELALEVDPRSEAAHVGLIVCHLRAARFAEAGEVIEESLRALPSSRRLQWLRLRIQAIRKTSGSLAGASVQSFPEAPQSVFELESAAMLRAALGDYRAAARLQESAAAQIDRVQHREVLRQRLEDYRSGRVATTVWDAAERVRVSRRNGRGAGSPSRSR
ncbi:MAG: tetratricopeptide repeat protein [Thermoanaerobaculia bacterium]|nr:tetratricopeptide repeat protein [Thermoanaerobaculia bacterium]